MRLAVDVGEECQEYAAFAFAFLASNRDLQRPLVELGALTPLVKLMAAQVIGRSKTLP